MQKISVSLQRHTESVCVCVFSKASNREQERTLKVNTHNKQDKMHFFHTNITLYDTQIFSHAGFYHVSKILLL